MSDLKAIIRQRGSLRGRLISFKKYLDERIKILTDAGASLASADVNELSGRLEKIKLVDREFETVQNQIESLVEEKVLDEQFKERENFECLFFSVASEAKTILDNHNQIQQNVAIDSLNLSGSVNGPNRNNRLKLPTIKLVPFSGRYDDWLEFREMFDSLIHKRDDLDNIEKYHYLRSTLNGEALQVIKAIEFTGSNYEKAWSLLKNRYNNERILVDNHVKALFNVEPLRHESAAKIRVLIDIISKHLQALKSLGQPIESWDTLIIHVISTKLDDTTLREWEEYRAGNELPALDDLKQFLRSRADLLETIEARQKPYAKRTDVKEKRGSRSFLANVRQCAICEKDHPVHQCEQLINMPANERFEVIRKHKLCANCLKSGHWANRCKAFPCKRCGRRHNTLLHVAEFSKEASSSLPVQGLEQNTATDDSSTQVTSAFSECFLGSRSCAILPTAIVHVRDKNGKFVECRALLDSGSQSNLITDRLCNKLYLPKAHFDISLVGVTEDSITVKHRTNVHTRSRINNFSVDLSCLVVPKIGSNLPAITFDRDSLKIPHNVVLADPSFSVPSQIDILIGASHFWNLICIGQIALGNNKPILQKTRFGWVVSGPLVFATEQRVPSQCNFMQIDLHSAMQRFWEIDEFQTNSKVFSDEEIQCENLFQQSTIQLADDHFMVQLPMKAEASLLGDSEQTATKRFYSIERRFNRDPGLAQNYKEFMNEYETLGHMSKIENTVPNNNFQYFVPHHAITKAESLTTKVRVVFDASSKSSTGYSLNDLLLVGPTIQQDLISIVLRFRKHKVALTADVVKMYRQVWVMPEQRSLQAILWRASPDEPLQKYHLNTVTYGTGSASFLAIRCLHETAYRNRERFPESAESVLSDFYVDDLLTGANSVEKARAQKKNEISQILNSGGFSLRKWISNESSVFSDDTNTSELDILKIGKDERTKTLGLLWDPNADAFLFSVGGIDTKSFTKRQILSCIAQIFDPMGLLSPVIIRAKIILQKLWQEKLDWDDSLPSSIFTEWSAFYSELPHLNHISFSRRVLIDNPVRVELHGFSDASMAAYGGCIYIRSVDEADNVKVMLLCAKTKVAPLKSLTIPRLELCGALTLARLVKKSVAALDMTIEGIYCWSDSTVVLGQLQRSPGQFQSFVSNRLAEIQCLTSVSSWRHVQTADNPADLLSRGIRPSQLRQSKLWFEGPPWLSDPVFEYTESQSIVELHLPEMRNVTSNLSIATNMGAFALFNKVSSLQSLKRAAAYCLRFLNRGSRLGELSVSELDEALVFLIKISQRESFPAEYNCLRNNDAISSSSRLIKLNPFMHLDGTVRVGGRLQNSSYEFNKKHPFILDSKHRLTRLVFDNEHRVLLHAGPQLLLASVRDKFWPISGLNLAKRTVNDCTRCFRFNPKGCSPIMGNLPQSRVTPSYPFEVTGVDYAGPFLVKNRSGRGCKVTKCYICLFVCFSTKCVHLELVTSLTSDAFILALRRFIARRGRPAHIYSDNGTNFVGAHSKLGELGEFLSKNESSLQARFANESINWHFIPAHSPHMGGLWEAGVKSTKFHLRRVAGNQSFTYEELYTLLCQVEAILNSRPLSPLSTDPRDDTPLTPSHFLIGRTMTSVPDVHLSEALPSNRLDVYQRIEQAKQSFWTRWSKEYISELQQRTKWRQSQYDIKLDTLVLVKDNNLPPMKWLLARVVELHPGKDGVTRVVTLKTSRGLMKRAVANLCPLPANGSA